MSGEDGPSAAFGRSVNGGKGAVPAGPAIEQGPPACESIGDAMPVLDARLSVLPAKEHDLRVEQRRKIDEPGLGTVDQAPVFVDAADQLVHPAHEPRRYP